VVDWIVVVVVSGTVVVVSGTVVSGTVVSGTVVSGTDVLVSGTEVLVSGTVVAGMVVSGTVVVVGIGPPGVHATIVTVSIAKKLAVIADRLISAP
jgi:hypothetical protein